LVVLIPKMESSFIETKSTKKEYSKFSKGLEMSRDKFRFDPNEDYSRWDSDSGYGRHERGNRKGFQPIRKGKKFRKDKFDGKRRNRFEEDRW